MKNLKSLQVIALAGVVVALTAGCSSTSNSRTESSDPNAAYRFASSGGWVPITDTRRIAVFPYGWTPGDFGPVSYETYVFTPPAVDANVGSAAVTSSSSASSTTIATDGSRTTISSDHPSSTTTVAAQDGSTTTITTTSSPQFNESLQPGDTFVEAAGANSDSAKVRRVILYSPFGTVGVGN